MSVRVTIDLNEHEIRALLSSPQGDVVQHFTNVGRRIERAAKQNSPADEGILRNSIEADTTAHANIITVTVGSPLDYAVWVHEGTGIYAGGDYIRPVSKKVMVFEPGRYVGPRPERAIGPAGQRKGKGGTDIGRTRVRPSKGNRGIVFATKVRGQPSQPFLWTAFLQYSPYPANRTQP